MNWLDRYNKMKKAMGWTNQSVADLLEKPLKSVERQVNAKDRAFPAWGRALVIMFEELNSSNND